MDETRQYDVALAECRSYEDEAVEAALRSALQRINGLDFVKPGMRIAVKTNLVTAMKPETAATVHPAVICALTRILRELGAEVVFGDGPFFMRAGRSRPVVRSDIFPPAGGFFVSNI